MHQEGVGGAAKDGAAAAAYYARAARFGHTQSLYNLGIMLVRGDGVPRNAIRACQRWRQAADVGHAPSQFNLANQCVQASPNPMSKRLQFDRGMHSNALPPRVPVVWCGAWHVQRQPASCNQRHATSVMQPIEPRLCCGPHAPCTGPACVGGMSRSDFPLSPPSSRVFAVRPRTCVPLSQFTTRVHIAACTVSNWQQRVTYV
jgi:TPR repeat protein